MEFCLVAEATIVDAPAQVRRIEGNDTAERFGLELAGALSRLERVKWEGIVNYETVKMIRQFNYVTVEMAGQ